MKVLKFGGSSVGSVEGLHNIKRIVESSDEKCIVVVSALRGITDFLLDVGRSASLSNKNYKIDYEKLLTVHNSMVDKVIDGEEKRETVKKELKIILSELKKLLKGVYLIKDFSDRISDIIISCGERMSSIIVANLINDATLYDATEFIKTERDLNGKNVLSFNETNRLIKETFSNITGTPVLGGFISKDKENGNITNLGRGGSDYTASLIAAALDASVLEIWTDVDGFMTVDPRAVAEARPIEQLSYIEATELCNFGAKVLFPPTIYPVYQKNIPILIKNTFNPSGKGTLISKKNSNTSDSLIRGISSIRDICLITFHGLGMVGVVGVNYRIFKALAKNGISVFLVAQASSENSTSIGVISADLELACKVLDEEFSRDIDRGEISRAIAERGLSTIAVVGENMKNNIGVMGKLFGTLGENGISVIACAQGGFQTNISFIISSKDLPKALNVIHERFFSPQYKELNLFIAGVGTVGSELISQIDSQQEQLLRNQQIKINIVGIANSHYSLINTSGIDLSNYMKLLQSEGTSHDIESYKNTIISLKLKNTVFVDCTNSEVISDIYSELLDNKISIVTANKTAASADYNKYLSLKKSALLHDVKFLYETNVGAGLPIISTIEELVNSGDKILEIEAVVSGSLNYIFNTISNKVSFSQAVMMAKENGYSESDPRIDLSGKDVLRKLVILSRESGYKTNQEEVEQNQFLPERVMMGTIEEFWVKISQVDEEIEKRRKELEKRDRKWRYIAKLENGKCSVGLSEIDIAHPFYNLEDSNNMFIVKTERYNKLPLIIKGYGAGGKVTAAGVFGDILKVAKGCSR